MKTIFFNILFFFTLLMSIFSITSKNPVISILFLISTFVSAACYLILIGINFIGISYIIVYIGAIAVLFLFVIMMINIRLTDILETGNQYTKTLPLALLIVTFFIYIFAKFIPFFYNYLSLDNSNFLFSLNLYNNNNLYDLLNNIDLSNLDLLTINKADNIFNNFLQIEVIGFNLYTYGAILLIICSFILLLSMFAAIIISRNK
jgi:NADH-ubiquinone oxidoreductase chain 6